MELESDEELDKYYTEQNKKMDKMFPNLPFSGNCDDINKMDDVLCNSNIAVIYYPLRCYCCCPNNEGAITILIYKKDNSFITYRDFYKTCEDKWKHELCDHRFLEDFEISNCVITPVFGS